MILLSIQIGRPHFFNGGLNFDFGCRSGRKPSKSSRPRMRPKPSIESLRFLRGQLYLITPHKKPQPAKLRHAHCEVREGIGCGEQQSLATRNDSRSGFVKSKLPASITKKNRICSRKHDSIRLRVTMLVCTTTAIQHVRRDGFHQALAGIFADLFETLCSRTRKSADLRKFVAVWDS